MDIAQLSTDMSAALIQSQVNTGVMKKAMDAQTEIAQTLIQNLSQVAPTVPKTGHIDITV